MSSIIERLDEVQLPFDEKALLSGKPGQLTDYLRQLIKILQDALERLTIVANFGIDSNDGEALYLGLKNAVGVYPIGTWRWIKVDSTLQAQEKITETGVDADDWQKVASHSR